MTSHRINGARVKAAARAHALKQLRHFGVSFHDGAGSTTFKGETAFASWNAGGLNGALQSFRINYPALPDNAMLSRREADLIAAYTLHELGHVAHTDNSVPRGEQLVVFKLWNGIEDARIEHAVIASGKARGARSMFKKLMSKFTSTHLGDQFNPTSINSAPFTLALVCRAAYGDGNGFAKSLLARIPEPYKSWYAAAAAGVIELPLDRSGTRGALSLARAFLEAWLSEFPDALARPEQTPDDARVNPKPSSGDSDDSDSDEQLSDSGGFGDSDDDESEDEGDAPYGDGSASDDDLDDNDFDFEPVAGDRWDDDAHDRDDGTDGVSRDQLEQDAADATEAAPESDDSLFDSAGDDADDGEGGSAGGDGGDSSFEPVENDSFDEERCLAPEPNVDDVFKNARGRTKAPIDLPDSVSPARSDMSKWKNLVGKDETSIKRSFKRLKKGSLPALKAQLYRILKAPEICGWDSGALGGRGLDGSYSSGEYNSTATLVVAKRFNQKLAKVAHHFGFMKKVTGGGTPDYTAVKGVCEQLSQLPHQRKVVIVITDGLGEDCGSYIDEARNRVVTDYHMRKLSDASQQLFGCDVIGFGIHCSAAQFATAYPIGTPVDLGSLGKSTLKGVIKQLELRDTRRVA